MSGCREEMDTKGQFRIGNYSRKRFAGVDPSLFFTCPSSATPSSTPSKDPSFIIPIDDISVSRNVNNAGQFVCSINSLLITGNADLSTIAGIFGFLSKDS